MHKTLAEAEEFMKILLSTLPATSEERVLIAPSFPLLAPMGLWAQGSCVEIGVQNIHDQESGAFTGEVSGALVKEMGASFTLIGHSERRSLFHEEGEFLYKKIRRALTCGLQPIFCVGETLEQRQSGEMKNTLKKQLSEVLDGLSPEEMLQVAVAYEPVWAIGTGKHATPDIAQEAHHFCRSYITEKWGEEVSSKVSILYGGSVKGDNIKALMAEKDIDGALIGGASLSPESFLQIIQYNR